MFFPQYLVLFNQLRRATGSPKAWDISYARLLGPRRIGLPIVRLECDFRAIGRMGETLTFGLAVERVGGKSLTLALEASGDGVLRVASRQVLVFTDLNTHRAIGLPEDVRAALAAV
ncbi:Putative 4-hydroxybenzoyl CoA thioesterase OS=Castellaniella defragrans (strain DSM / CCUG 39792/ 65Phen) OX=1437824 GN=BN940_15386 PE=4 SV=1 [Castellaniella denitrificans]